MRDYAKNIPTKVKYELETKFLIKQIENSLYINFKDAPYKPYRDVSRKMLKEIYDDVGLVKSPTDIDVEKLYELSNLLYKKVKRCKYDFGRLDYNVIMWELWDHVLKLLHFYRQLKGGVL